VARSVDHGSADVHAAQIDAEIQTIALHGPAPL
jgi:hypothetical protein